MNQTDQETIDNLYVLSRKFRYIYVVPALLLVPASFAIYFTEGKNSMQFFSINAFALVLTLILYGLTNYSLRTLEKKASQKVKEETEGNR